MFSRIRVYLAPEELFGLHVQFQVTSRLPFGLLCAAIWQYAQLGGRFLFRKNDLKMNVFNMLFFHIFFLSYFPPYLGHKKVLFDDVNDLQNSQSGEWLRKCVSSGLKEKVFDGNFMSCDAQTSFRGCSYSF